MSEDSLLAAGMPVELMVCPGDIRRTSIRLKRGQLIILDQTQPDLDADFLNQSIVMTFLTAAKASRVGCRVKVFEICSDRGDRDRSFIALEYLSSLDECDLRKYPRFNPKLFDRPFISLGKTVLDLKDISAGGARATYQGAGLPEVTKGQRIDLDVRIGDLHYLAQAEVMRFRRSGVERDYCEIAVAFMTWEKNFSAHREEDTYPTG